MAKRELANLAPKKKKNKKFLPVIQMEKRNMSHPGSSIAQHDVGKLCVVGNKLMRSGAHSGISSITEKLLRRRKRLEDNIESMKSGLSSEIRRKRVPDSTAIIEYGLIVQKDFRANRPPLLHVHDKFLMQTVTSEFVEENNTFDSDLSPVRSLISIGSSSNKYTKKYGSSSKHWDLSPW